MKTLLLFLAISASASAQLNYPSVSNSSCTSGGYSSFTSCLQAALNNNPHQTVAIQPGTYSLISTIYMNTDQRLVGAGSNAGGGTTLSFTSTATDTIGIRFTSYGSSASTIPPGGGGLQHLVLKGVTAATTGSAGIFLGGNAPGANDPSCTNQTTTNYEACTQSFAEQLLFEDLVVTGFNAGVEIGNNAYLDTFREVTLSFNNYGVYAPASLGGSGERMVFNECLLANNFTSAIADLSGLEWMIDNSSLDYATTSQPSYGPAISIAGGLTSHLYISNSHIEYLSSFKTNSLIYSPSGTVNINIQNSTFIVGSTSPPPSIIGVLSGSNSIVTVHGGFAGYQGTTILPFITGGSSKDLIQGAACTEVSGC